MPGQPKTEARPVRLDDDLWEGLQVAADHGYGEDRSTTLRTLARWFMREPGVKLPERPAPAVIEAIRSEASKRAAAARSAREAKRAAKKVAND